MKKVFYSIILLAVVSVMFSCKKSPEQLAQGTWKLDSVAVLNIDELVNSTVQMQLGPIEDQMKQLADQIAKLDPKKDKAQIDALTETQKQMEAQKGQINAEQIKADMAKGYNDLIGNTTFTFNEDKTYESKSFDIVEKGTWAIDEAGTTLTTTSEAGIESKMAVVELTETRMVCSVEMPSGDIVVKTQFVCTK